MKIIGNNWNKNRTPTSLSYFILSNSLTIFIKSVITHHNSILFQYLSSTLDFSPRINRSPDLPLSWSTNFFLHSWSNNRAPLFFPRFKTTALSFHSFINHHPGFLFKPFTFSSSSSLTCRQNCFLHSKVLLTFQKAWAACSANESKQANNVNVRSLVCLINYLQVISTKRRLRLPLMTCISLVSFFLYSIATDRILLIQLRAVKACNDKSFTIKASPFSMTSTKDLQVLTFTQAFVAWIPTPCQPLHARKA